MELDELIDSWQAAWESKRPEAFAEVCASGLHYEDPLTPRPVHGHLGLGEHLAPLWTGFPDLRVEQTGARLTDGRYVSAPVKLTGTHLAMVGGLPATGRRVTLHAVFYCELQRERLLRVRAFADLYGAAQGLGLLPAPGTLGARALLALQGFGLRRSRA